MSQIVSFHTSELRMNTEGHGTAVIEIERIVAGGFGLGRHESRVLLVPLTAPGDTVEVELPDRGPKARLKRIIVASWTVPRGAYASLVAGAGGGVWPLPPPAPAGLGGPPQIPRCGLWQAMAPVHE